MGNYKKINKEYHELVKAIFDAINNEYERLYWNKNQKNAASPFRNEGGRYSNNVFSVHSYSWDWDEFCWNKDGSPDINFNYKQGQFCATWYKHAHRGLYFWSDKKRINAKFLNKMLNDCLKSIQEDFEGGDPV